MRNAAILLALLSAPPAFAGWPAFPLRCHAELEPAWALRVVAGRKWETDARENTAKLKEMTTKICPDYFLRPNDAGAIQAFTARKAEILDRSPPIEKQGQELLAFLRGARADYVATFLPAGINFASNPCGLEMIATEKEMAARLDEIQRGIDGLTKGCFARTAAEPAAASPTVHGASGPAASPAKPAPIPSDITGIPEDKAKSKAKYKK